MHRYVISSIKYFVLLLFLNFLVLVANPILASSTCSGRFINPVTDVCWSCIMPINIGDVLHIGKGVIPKKRDTKKGENSISIE